MSNINSACICFETGQVVSVLLPAFDLMMMLELSKLKVTDPHQILEKNEGEGIINRIAEALKIKDDNVKSQLMTNMHYNTIFEKY